MSARGTLHKRDAGKEPNAVIPVISNLNDLEEVSLIRCRTSETVLTRLLMMRPWVRRCCLSALPSFLLENRGQTPISQSG